MDLNTTLSVIAAGIALASLVATLAQFKEDAWNNLRRWGKRAIDGVILAFSLISLFNGSLGIYLFWRADGIPTRNEILGLFIFLTNIGIGLWLLNSLGNARVRERKASKELALSASKG
jgi:hypothetical protein